MENENNLGSKGETTIEKLEDNIKELIDEREIIEVSSSISETDDEGETESEIKEIDKVNLMEIITNVVNLGINIMIVEKIRKRKIYKQENNGDKDINEATLANSKFKNNK